jgi:hypothetical protein
MFYQVINLSSETCMINLNQILYIKDCRSHYMIVFDRGAIMTVPNDEYDKMIVCLANKNIVL